MKKVFKRDSYWDELYDIQSQEDFISKINLENKFHSNVPRDIVDNFETALYLVNLSYFHFKLLDEAIVKILVTLELAVKFKAKELGLSLKTKPNKKGLTKDKKYFELIKEVLETTNQEYLKSDFDRARSMRNKRVHIDRHVFTGLIGYPIKNSISFMNLVNQLFLNKELVNKTNVSQLRVDSVIKSLHNKLCVLEYNETKILIHNILKVQYINDGCVELLIFLVDPIVNNVEEYFKERTYKKPLIIPIVNFCLKENSISGEDLNGGAFNVFENYNKENLKKYRDFLEGLKKVSEEDLSVHYSIMTQQYPWVFEKIIHQNCWN